MDFIFLFREGFNHFIFIYFSSTRMYVVIAESKIEEQLP